MNKSIKDSLKEKIALLRVRQGDTEAFGFIYDTYVDRIFRYVHFRVSDREIADDIVQEVFLQTWEHIASKKPVDNLQPFLYRVAYHKIVDYYRMKQRQTELLTEIRHDEAAAAKTDSTVEIELHFLKKQIENLKQEYQDVILLRHVEGLSITEITQVVGKDANNVRVTLHRAMLSLKRLSEDDQNSDKKNAKNNIT